MSPSAKKVTATDAVVRAFEEAEDAPPLTDDDRAVLVDAARDPRWVRLRRGDSLDASDGTLRVWRGRRYVR